MQRADIRLLTIFGELWLQSAKIGRVRKGLTKIKNGTKKRIHPFGGAGVARSRFWRQSRQRDEGRREAYLSHPSLLYLGLFRCCYSQAVPSPGGWKRWFPVTSHGIFRHKVLQGTQECDCPESLGCRDVRGYWVFQADVAILQDNRTLEEVAASFSMCRRSMWSCMSWHALHSTCYSYVHNSSSRGERSRGPSLPSYYLNHAVMLEYTAFGISEKWLTEKDLMHDRRLSGAENDGGSIWLLSYRVISASSMSDFEAAFRPDSRHKSTARLGRKRPSNEAYVTQSQRAGSSFLGWLVINLV